WQKDTVVALAAPVDGRRPFLRPPESPMSRVLLLALLALVLAVPFASGANSSASVAISQIYAGGGNAGATYTNDYVELVNRSSAAVSLTGWTVQYASAASTSWTSVPLAGSIRAGGYYLVKLSGGT